MFKNNVCFIIYVLNLASASRPRGFPMRPIPKGGGAFVFCQSTDSDLHWAGCLHGGC